MKGRKVLVLVSFATCGLSMVLSVSAQEVDRQDSDTDQAEFDTDQPEPDTGQTEPDKDQPEPNNAGTEEQQPVQEEEKATAEERTQGSVPVVKKQERQEERTNDQVIVKTEEEPGKKHQTDRRQEADFKRPFAGTSVYWSNQFTAISLDKSREYTYNPVFTMQFGAKPIWAVTRSFSLLTDIGFQTELTDSDYAKKKGEIFFNDIPIDGRLKYLLDVNEDVNFATGLNASVLIPSSKLSRYATLITALGIGTGATFGFPNVLKGLSLGWSPVLTKYLHKSENPFREGNPLDESSIPETEKQTSVHYLSLNYGGNENPTWSVSNSINLSLQLTDRLSFLFSYTHQYIYHYSAESSEEPDNDVCIDPQGCEGPRDAGFDERGTYMQIFLYNLNYRLPKPVDILSVSLGAVTASNQLAENGTYRTPFFNRHTVIVIGLSLDVDGTVSAISKGREE